MAGVFDLLIKAIMLVLGGYFTFISRTRLIRVLYKLDEIPAFTNDKGLIDFGNTNLQMAYIKNFSPLKTLCGCCRGKKDKKFT